MGDVPSPPRSNQLPMLYYGLVVMGCAAIVLVLYNLIIIKWCADHRRRGPPPSAPASSDETVITISSYKYETDGGDSECAVCLCLFEQGEQVKKLPNCKHSFHAPCIDMWLYSHLDCPLCRSPVHAQPGTDLPGGAWAHVSS